MVKPKLDKLGRRIPQFDRSAAGRKASKTRKDKYGADVHKRTGSVGGRLRTRGYFGRLKDEGKTDELKKIATEGANASNQIQSQRRNGSGGNDAVRGRK